MQLSLRQTPRSLPNNPFPCLWGEDLVHHLASCHFRSLPIRSFTNSRGRERLVLSYYSVSTVFTQHSFISLGQGSHSFPTLFTLSFPSQVRWQEQDSFGQHYIRFILSTHPSHSFSDSWEGFCVLISIHYLNIHFMLRHTCIHYPFHSFPVFCWATELVLLRHNFNLYLNFLSAHITFFRRVWPGNQLYITRCNAAILCYQPLQTISCRPSESWLTLPPNALGEEDLGGVGGNHLLVFGVGILLGHWQGV